MNSPTEVSPHSRVAALLLCWFLGVLGVHRFYLGKWFSGLVMLVLTAVPVGTFLSLLFGGGHEQGAGEPGWASMGWLMGCFYFACMWAFIDLMRIITGGFRDGKGRRVFQWLETDS